MAEERPVIHVAPCFRFSPVGNDDQRTRVRSACDLVSHYLAACRAEEGYAVVLSDLDYLRPFLATFSEDRSFLRGLVTLNRFDAAASHSQLAEAFVQGESLIRNLIYGRHYLEGVLSFTPAAYLSLGAPSHCLQFPQLLAKAGFEAMVWAADRSDLPPLCYLLAPDGSAVLLKPEPSAYQPHDFDEFIATLTESLGRQFELGIRHDLRLLGAEMAPPPPWLAGRVQELADLDPSVLISVPQRYLSAARSEAHLRKASLPLLASDLSRPTPAAVLSRADLKSASRLAENQLLNAEKWATLAGLIGARYPDRALDKAWRLLLYGQHHHALAGRIADLPYLDLLASCRESIELAAEVERRALSYLSLRIATHGSRGAPRNGAALVVFNSLCWSRTDICHALISLEGPLASGFQLTDGRGRPVPFQVTSDTPARPLPETDHPAVEIAFIAADVPSFGYRSYYLKPAPSLPEAEAGEAADTATIENEHFSVTADAALGGGFTSLRDKTLNLDLINSAGGPANELLAIAEGPGDLPCASPRASLRSRDQRAQLTVINGPVFSRLHAKSQLGDRCQLIQEVTLYRGVRRIDLHTSIHNYRGAHELLALAFPLALGNPTPIFEDPFAAIVRAPSPGPRDFPMRGLASAQNWMDAGPAPSLWIRGADRSRRALPLSPCAVITSADLRHRAALPRLLQALLARGITSTHFLDTADPDTDSACALRISLGRDNAYSKRVLTGNPQAAARLTETLSKGSWAAVLVSRPHPSDASRSVPTLVAHTSDPGGIPPLIEMLATTVAADEVAIPETCDFHKGARPADSHGLALLTGNTFAAALESDNTLVVPLFHTSPWEGHPWGQGKLDHFLIPEHKTHVFRYSLLPHRGDWREAGLVRAGREVTNPLIALEAPLQEGPLPTEFSLVSVDRPDVLITAVKPAGDPLPQQRPARRSLAAADIILRLYEAHGSARTAQLTFPAPPASAWLCDLLERKTSDLTLPRARRGRPAQLPIRLGPCEIATVGLRLSPLLDTPSHPEDLGPSTEPGQPVHSRYWDHNLGAAPLGNQPVTISMRGVLPRGKNTRFGLGISNDSPEREITGTVGIVAPATWTLIPRQVPYRIAPGSQAVYEIMVTPPADAPSCFLRAIVQDDDQLFQDVIPIGDIQPLAITLVKEGSAFLVTVENPNGDYVEGQVVLITPLESWGAAVGRLAVAAVSPRLYAFSLQAQAKQTFRFTVHGDINTLWAVAKVMWYGNVQYTQPGNG